jgi:hypothetical protein
MEGSRLEFYDPEWRSVAGSYEHGIERPVKYQEVVD